MRHISFLSMLAALAVLSVHAALAQDPAPQAKSDAQLKDDLDKMSYVIGAQIGKSLSIVGFDFRLDAIVAGVKDSLEGRTLALDKEQLQQYMDMYQVKSSEVTKARFDKERAENQAAQEQFLTENKKAEGVTTLPSGLQYRILTAGAGPIPKATDRIKVNYRGTLLNGKQFDSTYDRNEPAILAMSTVIKGWKEAMSMMPVGSKWQLFVPSELAYGKIGRPGAIPPNSMLVFELELLEILPAQAEAAPAPGAPSAVKK